MNPNKNEDLFSEDAEQEQDLQEDVLEKALDDALKNLENLEKGESTGKACGEKTSKADDDYEEDMDEDEYGEEEEGELIKKKKTEKAKKSVEEPDFESLSKSIPEVLEEEGADEILDAVPFVKALVDSVDDQLVDLTKAIVYLSDKISEIEDSLSKSKRLDIAQAKLVKSISQELKVIGDSPNPLKADLGRNLMLMRKSKDDSKKGKLSQITKQGALEKINELCKSKKIDLMTAVSMESRIQKNQELPAEIEALLVSN